LMFSCCNLSAISFLLRHSHSKHFSPDLPNVQLSYFPSQKSTGAGTFSASWHKSILAYSCFSIATVGTSNGNQNMKPHARSCHGSGRPAPSAAFCPHRLTQRRRQWRARSATHHRYFLIGHTAIKNARNSHENIILTFSNRPKIACFARVLRPTNRQSQPTNHAFLIPVSGIRIVRNFLKTNNGTPF
jgi:hypothetical protein